METEPTKANRTALSFLAHPDDAEFLCAGTLIRLRDAGWSVHVATATPGDCGSATQDRWAISAVRTNEAARACGLIAATYHCLDERDIFVVYDNPTLKKAIDLMRRVNPSVVFTHAPRDYMMDHEMVSQLARAATFAFGIPNVSDDVPAPPGAAVPHLYYCDPFEATEIPYSVAPEPTTLVDVTGVYDRKEQMLACHASQREWLRAHHGMDEYIEAMKRASAARGKELGAAYAEGFTQHRGHPYPQDDLLTGLFQKGK